MRKSSAPSRKQTIETTQQAEPSGSSGQMRKFSAVYAKASTRKHKVYTDDGILETRELNVTLKDTYGRYLGSTRLKYPVDSGSTLQVGGYELYISSEIHDEPPSKKFKPESPLSSAYAAGPGSSNEQRAVPQLKFMAIYGERSTRKFKNYPFEGTLEINGKQLVLKDFRGDFAGSGKSQIPITTGSEIQVGRFDVQVSDEIRPEDPTEVTEPAIETTPKETSIEESDQKSPRSQPLEPDSPSYSPDSSGDSSQELSHSSSQPVVFNAIYGKASATRVHKLYQKDGTIEVLGHKTVLKNVNNKVIATAHLSSSIESGSECLVGQYDVQVADLITKSSTSTTKQPELHRDSEIEPLTTDEDAHLTDNN